MAETINFDALNNPADVDGQFAEIAAGLESTAQLGRRTLLLEALAEDAAMSGSQLNNSKPIYNVDQVDTV